MTAKVGRAGADEQRRDYRVRPDLAGGGAKATAGSLVTTSRTGLRFHQCPGYVFGRAAPVRACCALIGTASSVSAVSMGVMGHFIAARDRPALNGCDAQANEIGNKPPGSRSMQGCLGVVRPAGALFTEAREATCESQIHC
jgi:hypothetical protein